MSTLRLDDAVPLQAPDAPVRAEQAAGRAASEATPFDVLIVGGGPAGLATATYLARFRRRVLVIDAGGGRARLIPRSYNCPGFPAGISGSELLDRLREQAARYHVASKPDRVSKLTRTPRGFAAVSDSGVNEAAAVVLATGLIDLVPRIPDPLPALADGRLRVCPVCDGYEVSGKRLAVVGPAGRAIDEAEFLLAFSADVTVLGNAPADFPEAARRKAADLGLKLCDSVDNLVPDGDGFRAILGNGEQRVFDALYPAMGCVVRSELAVQLGANIGKDDYLTVGAHQQTSIAGLYAVGDVAEGLNQLAVAFGHAAAAATAIHNSLPAVTPA